MIVKVESEKCTACEYCISICPMGCIEMRNGAAFVVASSCRGCQACQSACPTGAIVEDLESTRQFRGGMRRGGRPW